MSVPEGCVDCEPVGEPAGQLASWPADVSLVLPQAPPGGPVDRTGHMTLVHGWRVTWLPQATGLPLLHRSEGSVRTGRTPPRRAGCLGIHIGF